MMTLLDDPAPALDCTASTPAILPDNALAILFILPSVKSLPPTSCTAYPKPLLCLLTPKAVTTTSLKEAFASASFIVRLSLPVAFTSCVAYPT